jgi:hypothetical protein
MSSAQRSFRTTVGTLEQAVVDLIREFGELAPGEIVVHFDLVANTCRAVDGKDHFDRLRWTMPGANPHLTFGSLQAEATKIQTEKLT